MLRFVLALLLIAWSACAKPTQAPAVAAAAVVETTPGLFLYEVRGTQGSVHLLGTIHMGVGFDEVLSPRARTLFDAAQRVMTEADVSAANPEQLIQAALLPPDRTLKQIVGDATWQKLVVRVAAQIPEPVLDRLEPWLPSVMLGLEDLQQALGESASKNRQMDVELMAEATRVGKQLTYFETVAEQVAIFDSIPLEEQVRELARSLESEGSAQAPSLLAAFKAGDEPALVRALFDETEIATSPGFYERVLYQRNERWLPVIERELTRGGTFMAVGAGHLLGERGLLEALKRKGYTVARVGR